MQHRKERQAAPQRTARTSFLKVCPLARKSGCGKVARLVRRDADEAARRQLPPKRHAAKVGHRVLRFDARATSEGRSGPTLS
eukprot:657843-Pleurochrysis_carterae.AAC.5